MRLDENKKNIKALTDLSQLTGVATCADLFGCHAEHKAHALLYTHTQSVLLAVKLAWSLSSVFAHNIFVLMIDD